MVLDPMEGMTPFSGKPSSGLREVGVKGGAGGGGLRVGLGGIVGTGRELRCVGEGEMTGLVADTDLEEYEETREEAGEGDSCDSVLLKSEVVD